MTARKRGRPTPPPPAGYLQATISANGITIDGGGRAKVRTEWRRLNAIKTMKQALWALRGVGYTVVEERRNKRGAVHTYVLRKPDALAMLDEEQAA